MEETLKFSRTCKELMEQELEDQFRKHPNFIVSNYIGLSANDLGEFRRETRKHNSNYFVIKNSLCKRVMGKLELDKFNDVIDGGVGITFISGDPVEAAKMLFAFRKTHEPLNVKAAYIEGKRLDTDKLKELAALPTKDVLLAMVVSAIASPISGFVNVLNGVLRNFVYVINAIKDKKGESK